MHNDVKYCPYCRAKILTWHADGKCECEYCYAKFFVVESDDSEREIESKEE